MPIQKANLQAIQASKAQVESSSVVPTPVPELESEKEALVLGNDYITEEEAKKWVNSNARKPGEHFRTWRARLIRK